MKRHGFLFAQLVLFSAPGKDRDADRDRDANSQPPYAGTAYRHRLGYAGSDRHAFLTGASA